MARLSRFQPQREAEIGVLPAGSWELIAPLRSCAEELTHNRGIRALVPDIDSLVDDAHWKAEELKYDATLPASAQVLGDDRLLALVAYTHEQIAPRTSTGGAESRDSLRERRAVIRRLVKGSG